MVFVHFITRFTASFYVKTAYANIVYTLLYVVDASLSSSYNKEVSTFIHYVTFLDQSTSRNTVYPQKYSVIMNRCNHFVTVYIMNFILVS